ncbi:MAG TPA: glycosyltransferase [Acidimicrobiales bacterium]|nr:glycosyltransferase [Acidimicrobiales bacterium]
MRVVVVIPVRDGAASVAACVGACLGQTRRPDEVVVVDNGSTDATALLAAQAGARVVTEDTPGSYRARNRGWRSAEADVVAFTDVDCVPTPTWLAELVAPFEDDPTVAGTGGAIVQDELVSASQRWLVERRFLDQAFNSSEAFMPFFATANAAYRRRTLERLGGFDEAFLSGGDNDMSWRIQALTDERLVFRPEAVVHHHVGRRLGEVTGRSRRYAAGNVLLERRWSAFPGYPPDPGVLARTRRVWQLPAAVAYRLMTHRPVSVSFVDAAVALSAERGRRQGRRAARTAVLAPVPVPGTGARPRRRVDQPV